MNRKNYIFDSISYLFLTIFVYNVFFILNFNYFVSINLNYLFYLIGGFLTLIFSISLIETNILGAKKNSDISLNIRIMGPFFGNLYAFIRLFFIVIKFVLIYLVFIKIIKNFTYIKFGNFYFELAIIISLFLVFIIINLFRPKDIIAKISRYIISSFLILFLLSIIYLFFYYLLKSKIIKIDSNEIIYSYNLEEIVFSIATIIFSFSSVLDLFIDKIDIKKKRFFLIYIVISIFVIINLITIFIYFYQNVYFKSNLLKNYIFFISLIFIIYILMDNFFCGIRVIETMMEEKILPSFNSGKNKGKKNFFINLYYFLIFSIVFILLNNFSFLILIKTVLILLMLIFILSNLSSIILKENYSQGKLTNLIITPKLGIIFNIVSIIFTSLFIVYLIDKNILFFLLFLLFISLFIYILYGNRKIEKISLLKNIITKVLNREIEQKNLDIEIDKFLFSNGENTVDKFDNYVRNSDFIDLNGEYSLEEFFLYISEIISKKLNMNKDLIFNLFMEREKISSCALNAFVAIPHIVIEGTNKFEIIFVRAKDGVLFKDNYKIKAIFVLIGTKDQRNIHLQALASIAQVVMDENFEENWEKLNNINDLRNYLLRHDRRKIL